MSHTTIDPIVYALNFKRESDMGTDPIDLSKLPAYVTPTVAARLGVKAPGSTTETAELVDYSDGYGGEYAKGE